MDRLDVLALRLAGCDVGLIGDDDVKEAGLPQALERLGHAGEKLELGERARRVGLAVAHRARVEDAVAVEKDRAALHHFVAICCSAGCETRQCHTTAWKASVCGVTRAASTVGITITQSPTFFV